MFNVGDKVVYPQHGAGLVVARAPKTVLGAERDYLTIRIVHSDMTVMVPADAVDQAGLRRVMTPAELDEVLSLLRNEEPEFEGPWTRRFKHNQELMRTGDVAELVLVIRNLLARQRDKGLSSGERQMLARAKQILSSELQYSKDLEEDESAAHLDALLEEISLERDALARLAAD